MSPIFTQAAARTDSRHMIVGTLVAHRRLQSRDQLAALRRCGPRIAHVSNDGPATAVAEVERSPEPCFLTRHSRKQFGHCGLDLDDPIQIETPRLLHIDTVVEVPQDTRFAR